MSINLQQNICSQSTCSHLSPGWAEQMADSSLGSLATWKRPRLWWSQAIVFSWRCYSVPRLKRSYCLITCCELVACGQCFSFSLTFFRVWVPHPQRMLIGIANQQLAEAKHGTASVLQPWWSHVFREKNRSWLNGYYPQPSWCVVSNWAPAVVWLWMWGVAWLSGKTCQNDFRDTWVQRMLMHWRICVFSAVICIFWLLKLQLPNAKCDGWYFQKCICFTT